MWRRPLLALIAFAILLSVPRVVAAQPDTAEMATATTLFEAGQALVQEGNAEAACPKFEESYRLVPANGTLINLADCYERVGRTASAWLKFREVASKSARDGQEARAKVARERVAALEARLSRLRIVLGDNAKLEGLEVERDDLKMGRATLGIAVPVDPGEHRVMVRAKGYESRTVVVMIQEEGVTVDAVVPPLTATKGAATDEPGSAVRWQPPVGIAALALGSAGALAGVALGIAAKVKADDADCDADDFCSPEGLAQRDDAVGLGNIGTAVGIAGAIVAAFGLTVWLTAPDAPEPAAVGLGIGSLSLTVRY
jgi:serine/threonine-protein kinase